MKLLKSLMSVLMFLHIQLAASQAPEILQSPQNASVCIGGTVNFTCVVMFTSGTPGAANWLTNNGVNVASEEPNHSVTVDGVGLAPPANVTTVLTVTDVNINNNGSDYICAQGISVASDPVILTVYVRPSTTLNITQVTPLNMTSFQVIWTSDSNYNYSVTWTVLASGLTNDFVVQGPVNNYTITGLSAVNNYNVSVTAIHMCGMIETDPITVYEPPNNPTFMQCIAYSNQKPQLRIFSYVIVDTPRMSATLQFSTNYQNNTVFEMATCIGTDILNCTGNIVVSSLQQMEMVGMVTVAAITPYGISSSSQESLLAVNPIIDVTVVQQPNSSSATLQCHLPCFTDGILCEVARISANGVNHTNVTFTNGNVTGLIMDYSYPTQIIILSDLNSGTEYTACVVALNGTVQFGEQVCEGFTTRDGSSGGGDDSSSSSTGAIVGGVVGGIVAAVVITIIIIILVYVCVIKKEPTDDKENLRSPTGTGGSHTGGKSSVKPASSAEPPVLYDAPDQSAIVPHQKAVTGEEYAVSTKVTGKPKKQQKQQPMEEYAQIDKSKKKQPQLNYADLAELPTSGNKPIPAAPTATYAQVA